MNYSRMVIDPSLYIDLPTVMRLILCSLSLPVFKKNALKSISRSKLAIFRIFRATMFRYSSLVVIAVLYPHFHFYVYPIIYIYYYVSIHIFTRIIFVHIVHIGNYPICCHLIYVYFNHSPPSDTSSINPIYPKIHHKVKSNFIPKNKQANILQTSIALLSVEKHLIWCKQFTNQPNRRLPISSFFSLSCAVLYSWLLIVISGMRRSSLFCECHGRVFRYST